MTEVGSHMTEVAGHMTGEGSHAMIVFLSGFISEEDPALHSDQKIRKMQLNIQKVSSSQNSSKLLLHRLRGDRQFTNLVFVTIQNKCMGHIPCYTPPSSPSLPIPSLFLSSHFSSSLSLSPLFKGLRAPDVEWPSTTLRRIPRCSLWTLAEETR